MPLLTIKHGSRRLLGLKHADMPLHIPFFLLVILISSNYRMSDVALMELIPRARGQPFTSQAERVLAHEADALRNGMVLRAAVATFPGRLHGCGGASTFYKISDMLSTLLQCVVECNCSG